LEKLLELLIDPLEALFEPADMALHHLLRILAKINCLT